jgi:hypothetical protein
MSDFAGAAATLEKSTPEVRNEWWWYWIGKASFGLAHYEEAVNAFDRVIHMSKDPWSAFFARRAQARDALSDAKCLSKLTIVIQAGFSKDPSREGSCKRITPAGVDGSLP